MQDKYKMRADESEDDYKFRVCSLKDTDKLTWQEIADILNEELGENHAESTYRKEHQNAVRAFQRGLEIQKEKECTSKEVIELSDEDIQIERELKEKYATSAERMEYLRAIRQDSRFERFYEKVARQLTTLPVPEYVGGKVGDWNNDKEYILSLADLHLGAKFESVNNSYSLDEATRRMGVVYDYMVNFITKNEITKIKILSLGDVVQGMLRISDVKLNEKAVVDAFVFGCRLLADFLNKLSAYCKIEFLQVCFSNHEQLRLLGSKASELANEDMGKILFAYLTDVLRNNDRITVIGDTNRDYIEFKIFNFNCIALHGHQVNGINNLSKDLTNRNRKFYDYVFVGHTHSAKEIINAEGKHHDLMTLVSGSFCGSDPYADKLMVGSKASCKIYGFDKKYGYIESYRIILN